jgi:hypothetical protein
MRYDDEMTHFVNVELTAQARSTQRPYICSNRKRSHQRAGKNETINAIDDNNDDTTHDDDNVTMTNMTCPLVSAARRAQSIGSVPSSASRATRLIAVRETKVTIMTLLANEAIC